MTLDQLPIGDTAAITFVGGEGALRRRLLDLGLTPKTLVSIRKTAPMGDPIELHVRSYELTIRLDDARTITVCPLPQQFREKGCDSCSRREKCDSVPSFTPSRHHSHHGHHGHHSGNPTEKEGAPV